MRRPADRGVRAAGARDDRRGRPRSRRRRASARRGAAGGSHRPPSVLRRGGAGGLEIRGPRASGRAPVRRATPRNPTRHRCGQLPRNGRVRPPLHRGHRRCHRRPGRPPGGAPPLPLPAVLLGACPRRDRRSIRAGHPGAAVSHGQARLLLPVRRPARPAWPAGAPGRPAQHGPRPSGEPTAAGALRRSRGAPRFRGPGTAAHHERALGRGGWRGLQRREHRLGPAARGRSGRRRRRCRAEVRRDRHPQAEPARQPLPLRRADPRRPRSP